MTNYSSDIDGGLDKCGAVDDKTQPEPSKTRCKLEPVALSTLEHYVINNSLEFDKTDSTSMRINSNLYRFISNHFNLLKRDSESPGSIIRFNSIILNMGVKVFDERINPKKFDKLLLKVGEYADGCALGEFETNHALGRMDEPGYVFTDVYTKNWNQQNGTLTTNYYKNELLTTKFANIYTFGFTGKNGPKLTKEFMLLLGLRQSKTLSETSRAYDNIINITDATLDIFEQLIEGV